MNKSIQVLNIFKWIEMRFGHIVMLTPVEVINIMRHMGYTKELITDRSINSILYTLSKSMFLTKHIDLRGDRLNSVIFTINPKGIAHLRKNYKGNNNLLKLLIGSTTIL